MKDQFNLKIIDLDARQIIKSNSYQMDDKAGDCLTFKLDNLLLILRRFHFLSEVVHYLLIVAIFLVAQL